MSSSACLRLSSSGQLVGAGPSFQLITQAALACPLMHIALPMRPTAACSMQVHSKTQCTPFSGFHISACPSIKAEAPTEDVHMIAFIAVLAFC